MEKNLFSHPIIIRESDIDILGHVNNVVYVRWVQEVAGAHWLQVASEEIQTATTWVVLRHEIDYVHPAFLGDEIIGYTWVGEHTGAKFKRFVQLKLAKTDKIVANAITTWCLLNAKTMRPKRIDEEILGIL